MFAYLSPALVPCHQNRNPFSMSVYVVHLSRSIGSDVCVAYSFSGLSEVLIRASEQPVVLQHGEEADWLLRVLPAGLSVAGHSSGACPPEQSEVMACQTMQMPTSKNHLRAQKLLTWSGLALSAHWYMASALS